MSETAVERAYSGLRARIMDGTLTGGSFIDEATVCEAVGVSRMPAREAMHRLEGDGFITRVPSRGAQVRAISPSELFDVFHARYMIESLAAAEFCWAARPVPPEMSASLAARDEPHCPVSFGGPGKLDWTVTLASLYTGRTCLHGHKLAGAAASRGRPGAHCRRHRAGARDAFSPLRISCLGSQRP